MTAPTFYLMPAHGSKVTVQIDEQLYDALKAAGGPANERVVANLRVLLDEGVDRVPGRWVEEPWMQTPDPSDSDGISMLQIVGSDREDVSVICPALTGNPHEEIYLHMDDLDLTGFTSVELAGPVLNQRGDRFDLEHADDDSRPAWVSA